MFTVADIRKYLSEDDKILGKLDARFSNICETKDVNETSLDLIHPKFKDPLNYIEKSLAKVIIAPLSIEGKLREISPDKTIILSKEPKLLFAKIANDLFVKKVTTRRHPTAYVHLKAKLGKNVHIGAFCYIGKCKIGDGCVIHSHVSIEDGTVIGNNVTIKSGARIGQQGSGYVKNENGEYINFPQIGTVIIEDNVVIGSNSSIDGGALKFTKIGRGTKIDNQVQVAHNVLIGENCIITASVCIGGSCEIGNNVWIGLSASIKNKVKIGDGAFISMGSVVIRDLEAGASVIGNPAEDTMDFVKKERFIEKMMNSEALADIVKE